MQLPKFVRRLAAKVAGGFVVKTTRQTIPSMFVSMLTDTILPRQYKEFHNKDLTDLSKWDHQSILKVLRAVSPEVSQAVAVYLRMFDSGYSIKVKKKGGGDHQSGGDALSRIIGEVEAVDLSAGFALPNRIRDLSQRQALDALFKGAIAGELVFDSDLKVRSIQYVDPWSIFFEWDKDQMKFVPYQWQMGEGNYTRKLDIPNFFYIPVDPMGDDPYGEEQITPVIQSIVFKAQVLQDIRRAVHTNGWDRLDFEVLDEAIKANIPPDKKNDPLEAKKYYDAAFNEIQAAYNGINPDDNIVHTDNIKVTPIHGQMSGKFDPSPLLNVIAADIANSLKTFQLILSKKFGGGSEGFSSGELVLYVKLIAGYQNFVENFWERALSLALRVQEGLVVDVDFSFYKPELRTDTEIAQYVAVGIANANNSYASGAIGQSERVQRIRDLQKFEGPLPNDVIDEPLVITALPDQPGSPAQPQRPSGAEPGKEQQRSETNRNRRSGRN